MRIGGRIALTASLALLLVTACDDDDDATPTPTSTISVTAASTASHTPTEQPTASPLGADSPEVQQTLALPGLVDFLREFELAVDGEDAEWFVDHTHFETVICPSLASNETPPPLCSGIAPPPSGPGIMMGAWNSEGSMVTEDYYVSQLRSQPPRTVQMYAIGHQQYGLELGPSEVGIVVVNPGLVTPLPTPFGGESVTAYRVDQIDGEWNIVGVDGGLEGLVPYFFDWYAPWDVVEPELG
jgi:hypothetical protein